MNFLNRFEANSRQPMIFFHALWGLSSYDLNFIFVSCMPQITISVKMPGGTLRVMCEANCTVHALKLKIQRQVGLDSNRQRLFLDDEILADEAPLSTPFYHWRWPTLVGI